MSKRNRNLDGRKTRRKTKARKVFGSFFLDISRNGNLLRTLRYISATWAAQAVAKIEVRKKLKIERNFKLSSPRDATELQEHAVEKT